MSVASVGAVFNAPAGGVTPLELPRSMAGGREFVHKGQTRADLVRQAIPGDEPGEKPHALNSIAADLERISLTFNKKLQFVVDHSSHEVIVKVIDKETDKVIKELPPEELQRLHNKLKETIGFLFDERV
jgi:flagellar protein FlaG